MDSSNGKEGMFWLEKYPQYTRKRVRDAVVDSTPRCCGRFTMLKEVGFLLEKWEGGMVGLRPRKARKVFFL